jgi:hypothetical protein
MIITGAVWAFLMLTFCLLSAHYCMYNHSPFTELFNSPTVYADLGTMRKYKTSWMKRPTTLSFWTTIHIIPSAICLAHW